MDLVLREVREDGGCKPEGGPPPPQRSPHTSTVAVALEKVIGNFAANTHKHGRLARWRTARALNVAVQHLR